MRILSSLLSILYIAAIFLLAGSPIVEKLSTFNPHSLLHIPLYGILTVFLIFSIFPITPRRRSKTAPQKPTNQTKQINPRPRIFIAGLMALGVAIFDEIYQIYIPQRNASITDVLLDLIGISLAVTLILKIHKNPNDNLQAKPNKSG